MIRLDHDLISLFEHAVLWRKRHRFARNQNGKHKVVVIVLERGGNSVPAVFHSESQASAFIRARIAKGTVVHADEAASWDNLHERFEVKRINHQEAYSLDGVCTNWAEEYFSRLRRAEVGIHHHIAGAYLLRYAQESSWREDNRRVSNGDQVSRIAALAVHAVDKRSSAAARNLICSRSASVTDASPPKVSTASNRNRKARAIGHLR
jgi:ISXO2-like transposase domain